MRRLLWIAVLVSLPACHDRGGPARVEVRGNATYQGAPIEHGMITFRPAHGSKGPAAGTAIIDGKFFLPVDKGPIAGPHDVEVKIVDLPKDAMKSDQSTLMTHGAGQLKSFSQQIDVTSGVNEFEFSFPSSPPSMKSGPR
jgi:hypothetical protein